MSPTFKEVFKELVAASASLQTSSPEEVKSSLSSIHTQLETLKAELQVVTLKFRSYERQASPKAGVPLVPKGRGPAPILYYLTGRGKKAHPVTAFELRGYLELTTQHIANLLRGLNGLQVQYPGDPSKWVVVINGYQVSLTTPGLYIKLAEGTPPASGHCEKHNLDWQDSAVPLPGIAPGCPACAEEAPE